MWASPEVNGQPANTYAGSRSSCGGGTANARACVHAARQRASIGPAA